MLKITRHFFKNVWLNKHKGRQWGLALLGGFFMGLTPAPVQAWPLAWVAVIPLWILVVQQSQVQKDKFCWFPLFWGIGYHGLALSWITGIHPMTWMGVPWLASLTIALFCWIFITLCGAVLVLIWGNSLIWLWKRAKGSIGMRVLTGTALWCVLEMLWSWGPLYWSSIAYTQSPHNLVILHLGRLSGPLTVTAAIMAVNGLFAEAWLHRPKPFFFDKKSFPPALLAALGLLLGLHLLGLTLYSQPLVQRPADALKVGIIQGNIPNTIKLSSVGWAQAIEGYANGYRTLADQGVEAVLTPETALPIPWMEPSWIRADFLQAVQEKQVPVWIGAFGQTERSLTNSLFTVTGTGETLSRYDKVKLVPLGEYIPFEQALGKLINRLSPLDAHLAAGIPDQVFDTPVGRAIVSICYESAFASHFRRQAALGGEFILTASNNAHYSETMPAQHHAQDVMRAIETDRWAVRATNTGYSGFVNPHGQTVWISGINTYETHAETIDRRRTQTLYSRWGDWLTLVLAVAATVVWYLNRIKPFSVKETR